MQRGRGSGRAGAAALAVLFVGLVGVSAPARAAARFEPGTCPRTEEPVPALANARCGTLVVPENRAKPNGREVRLPVAIIPALSDPPAADPVVYMEGGPGGAALPSAQLLLDAGLNRGRDVIVMGQRGTRYAEPALLCPEIDAFHARRAALAYDAPSTGRLAVEAARACYRRLAAEGIELAAYNTTASAADFADLRAALGIAVWNVYGVSYGTDLALTYMRVHPQGIRSVTIDSVVPPQLASAGLNWLNAGVGLGNIFRACAAERACRARYPRPAAVLARLVRRLEAAPLQATAMPVLLPGEKPAPDARPVEVVVDGGALVNWAIGVTEMLGPKLPALLDDMARGRTHDVVASIAATAGLHQGDLSWGLHNGVVCSEWVPYERAGDVARQGRRAFPAFPAAVLAQAPQFPFLREICGVWQVPKAPAAQRAPARGGIPTLVVAGSYDAITSPRAAQAAAAPLTAATLVVIPGVGHFVVPKSECAQRVVASFLADPSAPDTTCVAALRPPPFVISPAP
jgi:pimeloyl-ACP methyl ester carboxylesterase